MPQLHVRDNSTTAAAAAEHVPLKDRNSFAVRNIPFQDDRAFDSLQQYAGQVPMDDDGEAVMFFWLIGNATNIHNKDKLVLWLNGGPGCTSLDGVFMENGPYHFDGPNTLRFREHSLSQQFDVLYIDQPFGTGFSTAPTASYMHSFKDANAKLLKFLARFFDIFPEYRTRQLYIAGESEAGVYIPYLADSILKMPEESRYNVSGLMIGNGWIDPYPMYMSYVEILRARNMLSEPIHKKMLEKMDACTREFARAPQPVHTDICERIPSVFLDEGGPEPDICYNQYDLRLTDTQPSCGMNWPPEVGMFTDYLNRKDFQRAINVGKAPSTWVECNNVVNSKLRRDTSPPSSTLLPAILDRIPVLFFVGKEDYLCNYIGTEWTIGNLTWAGGKGFSDKSQSAEWSINGKVVGDIVAERGLTYALIHEASHMVGVDKPREILDLFTAFTNGSAANLQFRSSFRSGSPNDRINLPAPSTPATNGSSATAAKWIALVSISALLLLFAACFWRRKQLFAWWMSRRHYNGGQRLDDALVLSRNFSRSRSQDFDDAFMMSEFAIGKVSRSRDSLDLDGMLLDDGTASSPDDDIAGSHSSKNLHRSQDRP
ncbi:Cell death protease [Coemansia guatemalensis]|uniref:Pheromone-processing carboxypeptidase KEX1 n=1 Tax=Coemansia guatemalensis TaxID=2761395 RepID=A0A9W8HUE6_9FUNG|nr:Cell death protease [Coemansia guatemalensis]